MLREGAFHVGSLPEVFYPPWAVIIGPITGSPVWPIFCLSRLAEYPPSTLLVVVFKASNRLAFIFLFGVSVGGAPIHGRVASIQDTEHQHEGESKRRVH